MDGAEGNGVGIEEGSEVGERVGSAVGASTHCKEIPEPRARNGRLQEQDEAPLLEVEPLGHGLHPLPIAE